MKRMLRLLACVGLLLILSIVSLWSTEIYSAGYGGTIVRGNWSSSSTWWGGTVPGPGDDVYINDMDTVVINASVEVNNLTVGSVSGGAVLQFTDSLTLVKLTVTGNFFVMTGSTFRVQGPIATIPNIIDTIAVSGDFINEGATMDLRSSQTGVCNLILEGPGNSALKSTGVWESHNNEFNGITINKSGTGTVLLSSDIFLGNSSTTTATNPYLTLQHGLVVTGPYAIVCRATRDELVVGGDGSSYVIGTLGRAMSNSGSGTRLFPVGDEDGYRPIRVRNVAGTNMTGHNLRVQVIQGDANIGGASFSGGIDKVASVRYYKLTYQKASDDPGNYPTMTFDKFYPSYGRQDGVGAGNSSLRVACKDTLGAEWRGLGQVTVQDTTKYTDPPDFWSADSLPGGMTLRSGGPSAYVAIARASGTTENSLVFDPSGVAEPGVVMPGAFSLSQNYPNPFNPRTVVRSQTPVVSDVRIVIYDLLGREVEVLVNERRAAGSYEDVFDGSGLASGIYIYRLSAGSFVQSRRMVLLK